jgi:hypothetical protein
MAGVAARRLVLSKEGGARERLVSHAFCSPLTDPVKLPMSSTDPSQSFQNHLISSAGQGKADDVEPHA